MLIDWFTIGAQALNFLILVWLLKHFLYKPILNAIDAREKLIAKELADAGVKKAEAQNDRDEFRKKNEQFDQQRAALLAKATGDAKAEGQRLLDEARKSADRLSAKRQESLINDARSLNQSISQLTQREVFAITRKALTDLATTSLEERLGEVFTRRLRELDSKAKTILGGALKMNSEPALVRSTFDIPAAQRAAIQNALNETFSADIHLRFETSPDLISGIELSANGQKVGWSIADYLASLEKGVGELLKVKDQPAPKPELKAEPKLEPPSESKTETKAEGKPKAESDPKTEIKPDAKPLSNPEVKVEAKPEVEAAPKPEAKVEPKPIAPKPEEKPASKPAVKAESKPEPPSEAKSEARADDKPKVESDPKPEVSDAKPLSKPEVKVEAAPKSEAKVTAKPETEVESKAAPEAIPKPEEAMPAS